MATMDDHIKQHLARNKHIYAPGVLNPNQHFALVNDIQKYAKQAWIPEEYIYHSMVDYTDGPEIEWMQDWYAHRRNGVYGLVLTKNLDDAAVIPRMSAIVGCALRNFIPAKVMPLQDIISGLKNETSMTQDLICCPNFFLGDGSGEVASWQVSTLLGWLYSRMSQEKYTVVFVSDLNKMKAAYGASFLAFFQEHFTVA